MHETARTIALHLRAIVAVLRWPCHSWHHPGDDECFASTYDARLNELTWGWASVIPERAWGILDR
jgi:hypothetical protein